MGIDWKHIASQVDGLTPDGRERIVGTEGGRHAIEILLGENNLREAVDYWIDGQPGCFTAEMVLKVARPRVAMERCYEIFKSSTSAERRSAAVFLLACFADVEALPWINDFLNDTEKVVRWNALQVLRYILYGPVGNNSISLIRDLLNKADSDPDLETRRLASEVRQQLERQEHNP